ncbi:retrovirus-related pol polyprotein from transposon TNT 1-94 [Tanacetum coccineum]
MEGTRKVEDLNCNSHKGHDLLLKLCRKRRIDLKNPFAPVCSAWKQRGLRCSAGRVVDPDHPEKVYLLRKALYGLKQAPRAWYDETINIFLMSKGFTKGTIDPTLFKIKYGEDILLVQIYVDDIIFGSTNPKYSKRFEKLMHSRFEMSLMGEMKFFLGLQIHQSPKGIFINQAKYALEILQKHNMDNCHSIGTPLATKPKLDVDLSGEPVDQSDYRSKIGSLMYYDISDQTCASSMLLCNDSGFELTAFSDADHAGCLDTRKSTSGGIQFLGDKLVSWMSKKQNCTAMSSAEGRISLFSSSSVVVVESRFASVKNCSAVFSSVKMLLRSKPESFGYQSPNVNVPFRKFDSSSYQALGACFKPTKLSLEEMPLLPSIDRSGKDLCAAWAKNSELLPTLSN